jgi:4'-phosphopantetheinyl transferase
VARLPGGTRARLTLRQSKNQAALAVYPWSDSRPLIAVAPEAGQDLMVISVTTPNSTLRDAARAQLRDAVREVLGLRLHRAPETIPLLSMPGQAIRVDLPGHMIGLSASHESGISVAAIRWGGLVGVDIMRLPEEFEWQPVARDYLGLQAFAKLERMPQHEQLPAFTREWTRLEAALKCLGIELQESNASLDRQIRACRIISLELPAGLFGSVAFPVDKRVPD